MVTIKKQKLKAYILLEGLVALALLATIISLILGEMDRSRTQMQESLHQQEVLNVATMAAQIGQDHLAINGVEVRMVKHDNEISIYDGQNEVLHVKKTRLKAFTLLESLVALLVISGSILVYQGLTQSISSNIHYLSVNQEEKWLLFSQQLRSELAGCQLDKVADNKLYVSKGNQQLAYGLSKADDFRKTNASGQGISPCSLA